MSTAKERVLEREFNAARALAAPQGKADAEALQLAAPDMTGTELNGAAERIPLFTEAVKVKNMLKRPIGFVCMSSARRVVKLLQPYDSTIYQQEPEMLPAQWGFVWSNDPAHARPWISLSTSPYMIGNVCTVGLDIFRSRIDNNVWSPLDYEQGWEWVGNVLDYQA